MAIRDSILILGVTGGVASGKSLVSEHLRQLGAEVVEADRLGHEVLEEEEVKQALTNRWGESVLTADGKIDRPRVAQIVFEPTAQGASERRFLEHLTHPRMAHRLKERLESLSRDCATKSNPQNELSVSKKVVVLDAALIFEAGWNESCDKVIFVEASRAARWNRAQRRGWSEADFEAREAAQAPLESKKGRSDLVIDNSGSPDDTFSKVRQVWRSLPEISSCGGSSS